MTGCSGPAITNSANPAGEGVSGTTPPPAGGEGGGDPSMEDILASIRRILNEDEAPPGSPTGAEEEPGAAETHHPAPAAVDGGDGVLVLDEAMLVQEAPPEPFPVRADPVQPHLDVPTSPPTEPAAESAAPIPPTPGEGLMAPESTAAAAASVGSLLRSLSQERTTQVYRGGPTIEDLVREEVRPLLKAWLDTHLPPLVERLVRQEIERVAGRAAL